jgi:hypothetical protein
VAGLTGEIVLVAADSVAKLESATSARATGALGWNCGILVAGSEGVPSVIINGLQGRFYGYRQLSPGLKLIPSQIIGEVVVWPCPQFSAAG